MKPCTRCKKTKPLDQFPKEKRNRDGRSSWCKACYRKASAAYRATPKGHAATRASGKRWRDKPENKAKIAAREATPERRAYRSAYRRTEKGKESACRTNRKARRRKKETEAGRLQLQAGDAINNAVTAGRLPAVATLTCSCGHPAEVYHHSRGYAKRYWFHVIPLCRQCHAAEHSV